MTKPRVQGCRSGTLSSFSPVSKRIRWPAAFVVVVASMFVTPLHAAEATNVFRPGGDGTGYGYSDFGGTIDIDGNRMVVGASALHAAYVYRFVDGGWQHAATLPAPVGESPGTKMAVALDGDVIAVGMTSATIGDIENAGTVFVFEQGDTAAQWREVARLTAEHPLAGARFGEQVAVDGGRILASGEPTVDPAGYLFERDASGAWNLAWTFNGADGSGLVVHDVAIDGDRIAFANRARGGAQVYERGAAAWVASAFLPHAGAYSIALEGDVLVVGTPYEDLRDKPRSEGAAHVHEYANGEWHSIVRLHSPYENAYGYFGIRMDLQDGLLVVGEGHETGAWFAFRKNEVGEWVQFDGHGMGSMHGMVHVPAISARNLAIGYTGMGVEVVTLYDVGELMADGEDPGDEVAVQDDGGDGEANGADTGDGAGEDEAANDTDDGIDDGIDDGTGGGTAGATADGNAGTTDATASGGDGAGAAASSTAGSPGDAPAGGGGFAGVLALLLSLFSLLRTRRAAARRTFPFR